MRHTHYASSDYTTVLWETRSRDVTTVDHETQNFYQSLIKYEHGTATSSEHFTVAHGTVVSNQTVYFSIFSIQFSTRFFRFISKDD